MKKTKMMQTLYLAVFLAFLTTNLMAQEPPTPAAPQTAPASAPTMNFENLSENISKNVQKKLEKNRRDEISKEINSRRLARAAVYGLIALFGGGIAWFKKRKSGKK